LQNALTNNSEPHDREGRILTSGMGRRLQNGLQREATLETVLIILHLKYQNEKEIASSCFVALLRKVADPTRSRYLSVFSRDYFFCKDYGLENV
jgi:hypothetical protein